MQDDRLKELIIKAVASFNDACTIPRLSPECPYYENVSGQPTCGEECREILERWGHSRPTTSKKVLPGLVMTGVARPMEVAAGVDAFDATAMFLNDIDEPDETASTTTLMLRLRGVAGIPPWAEDQSRRTAQVDSLWAALAAREMPVEGILRVGVAPEVARQLLSEVRVGESHTSEWARVLKACRDAAPQGDEWEPWILSRVSEWFASLANSDLDGFLAWKPPPAALLANLSAEPGDEEALWLWERFTVADLESWSTASLLRERQYRRSPEGDRGRVLAARVVDLERVNDLALDRVTQVFTAPAAQQRQRNLSSERFMRRALESLASGEPDEAAEIFAALVYLEPGDGEALNNLGFCLIAVDVNQAIGPLDRASRLRLQNPALNAMNRAFVRHLLGRGEEALAILDELAPLEDPTLLSVVWVEEECGQFAPSLMPLAVYREQLRQHINPAAATD